MCFPVLEDHLRRLGCPMYVIRGDLKEKGVYFRDKVILVGKDGVEVIEE